MVADSFAVGHQVRSVLFAELLDGSTQSGPFNTIAETDDRAVG